MGRLGGPLVAGALFLMAVAPVRAQGACSLTQITSSIGKSSRTFNSAINAGGNRIVFNSNADFVGSNGDGSFELFLWDASTGITQITNINGPFMNPAINADGTRVVFQSNTNSLGTNGDGNFELFLWDASTGLTQITNATSGNSAFPSINAAGNRIAFDSDADLVGSNGDGNREIFLWDFSTGFTQVTNTTGGKNSFFPRLNAGGNRIAFHSDANPLNSNVDGNFEIFLWDASTGLSQITNSITGGCNGAAINAAGNRIAFVSDADLAGSNSDRNNEIFLWDSSTGFTQITNSVSADNLVPAINAAGNRIAFDSNGDLLGNSDSYEVFLWDSSAGLTQVTNSIVGSGISTIDAAGVRIAFGSSANFLGSNSDGNGEVFLASCALPLAEVPAVSPLGLGLLATLLSLVAAWTLRRRHGYP